MAHITFSRDPITKMRRDTPFIKQLTSTTEHYMPEGKALPAVEGLARDWRTTRLRPQVLRTAELLVARYSMNNPGKAITVTEAIAAVMQKGLAALVREDDFLPPIAR
jgi:hypothetical protein